jgi:hypothetical protein
MAGVNDLMTGNSPRSSRIAENIPDVGYAGRLVARLFERSGGCGAQLAAPP